MKLHVIAYARTVDVKLQVTTDETYAAAMSAKASAPPAEPRWLNAEELETWKTLHVVMATLPAVLGGQLRRDRDLTFLEYYVLAGLSEQPDHTLRMSQLALFAGSELSRLSHLMRRLEERGLVRREPDPSDGRFTHAILTAKGLAEVVKAAPGHVEYVRSLIFDVLDDAEQRALRCALAKIVAKLDPTC